MSILTGRTDISSSSTSYLPMTSKESAQNVSISGSIELTNTIDFGDEDSMVVRLSPDKDLWAVGLSRGSIKLYSTSDPSTLLFTLTPDINLSCVTCLSFIPFDESSPPERKHLLLSTHAHGQIRIWHYTGANNSSRLLVTLEEERQPRPDELAHRMNNGYRGGGGGGGSGFDSKASSNKLNQIICCSCSLDGLRFITAGEDSVVRVYDLKTRQVLNRCSSSHNVDQMDGHVMRICALQYHPWGKTSDDYVHIFISGGWDNSVHIWDDRLERSLWCYYGPHISGSDSLSIDPIQNHILTGSWRREKAQLQIWKFNDEVLKGSIAKMDSKIKSRCEKPLAEMIQDPNHLPSMGYVAQWLGDQYIMYGGSNCNMAKIIDRGTLHTIGSLYDLPNGVFSMAAFEPEAGDKRATRVAICAGKKLYVVKINRS